MIKGDDPIKAVEEDLLGRAELAKIIAREIRCIDASEGFVVGILGPWGSGKTSLINLIGNELEAEPPIVVLEFNPWMFSGTDELVARFFEELSQQLELGPSRLEAVAKSFASYSKVAAPLKYVPVAGAFFEALREAGDVVGKVMEDRKGGVVEHRKQLREVLRQLEFPIVVVIDDVDRLTTSEIRDVFKLIRLTASFPKIIYLVAFDRRRVEKALKQDGLPGRDYLEKIVQLTYDLPVIPDMLLSSQIAAEIGSSLEHVPDQGKFDETRWPRVFNEIVLPQIRSMRDVRRYVASLPGTVRSLDGRVALVDVLGLEAIRVFAPDLFEALPRTRFALTPPPTLALFEDLETDRHKEAIDSFLRIAGKRRKLAEALIERLFPSAIRFLRNEKYGRESLGEWAQGQRVARRDVFEFYLERVAGGSLRAQWQAQSLIPLLADEGTAETYFLSLDRMTEMRQLQP